MSRGRYALHCVLVVLVLLTAATVTRARALNQPPNQVGLVIDFGDGTVITRCIEFTEQEITGYDVLRRSGLSVVADEVGMGVTVCDIEGTSGCSASTCFCECQGMTCTYWRYYYLEGGTWQYSPLGASARTVRHGDVEGWAWAEGNPGSAARPPVVPFRQICATADLPTTQPADAATPTSPPPSPTSTSRATAPPSPSPTPPPSPTATSPPSPTPSPTVVPSTTPSPGLKANPGSPASPTPAPQAPPEPTQPRATDDDSAVTSEPRPSYRPLSYALFGLIVAALVGWLVFASRVRK